MAMGGDAEFKVGEHQSAVLAELLERLGAVQIESNEVGNGRVVLFVHRLKRGKVSEEKWVIGPKGRIAHYPGGGLLPIADREVAMREAGPA
jgi:hypothetical protein